jgi:hypothetical protein
MCALLDIIDVVWHATHCCLPIKNWTLGLVQQYSRHDRHHLCQYVNHNVATLWSTDDIDDVAVSREVNTQMRFYCFFSNKERQLSWVNNRDECIPKFSCRAFHIPYKFSTRGTKRNEWKPAAVARMCWARWPRPGLGPGDLHIRTKSPNRADVNWSHLRKGKRARAAHL